MALYSGKKQEAGDNSQQYQTDTGDIIVNNHPQDLISGGNYKKLADEYRKERASKDSTLNIIIDKIQKYSSDIDTEFIGLPKKLKDGGFEEDIDFAMALKESYGMYLFENNLSLAKQRIHGYLLAKTLVYFKLAVTEAIREKKTNSEIKQILLDKVIKPIENELGVDNVLDLYCDDILGMVYFLTGNCHINWT